MLWLFFEIYTKPLVLRSCMKICLERFLTHFWCKVYLREGFRVFFLWSLNHPTKTHALCQRLLCSIPEKIKLSQSFCLWDLKEDWILLDNQKIIHKAKYLECNTEFIPIDAVNNTSSKRTASCQNYSHTSIL